MTRTQLQTALKTLRNDGYDVQIKLNAKTEVLQTEYDRLTVKSEAATEAVVLEPLEGQVSELTCDVCNYQFSLLPAKADQVDLAESLEPSTMATPSLCPEVASYWVDGKGVSLESTQVQALRNLEEGLRWIGKTSEGLRSFSQGFMEGLKKAKGKPEGLKAIPLGRIRDSTEILLSS